MKHGISALLTAFRPDSWKLLLATFWSAQVIGLLGYWTLPIALGALTAQFHLTPSAAGLVSTTEFCGVFLGTLSAAPMMGRVDRRMIAIPATLALVGFDIASAIANLEIDTLTGLRFCAGLAAGVVLACGNAALANASRPARLANHASILLILFMVVAMPALARISEAFGYSGVMIAMACTTALGISGVAFLPSRPTKAVAEEAIPKPNWRATPLLSMVGLTALGAVTLLGIRDTLPWLFSEQVGRGTGMTLPQIGDLYALMYLLSPIGPIAALVLGRVLPPIWVMCIAIIISGASGAITILAETSQLVFVLSTCLWSISYFAAYAEISAFIALLDRSGQLASAIGSALMLGIVIAPIIGAAPFVDGRYEIAAALIAVATVIMLLLIGYRYLPWGRGTASHYRESQVGESG